MLSELTFWIIFIIIAALIFTIDVYVTDNRKGKIKLKTSLMWSSIYISTALLFGVLIFFFMENGEKKAIDYITGYLIEESLSVDNLFVFILIFRVMGIKDEVQPHILKWGILSAIIMRIFFIMLGVALIELFHPIIYLFGALLLFAAYRMIKGSEAQIDLENNFLIKFVSKRFNILYNYSGKKFFVKQNGVVYLTPLFLTLLLIESADLIFAIDSIPAILSITNDTFLIITSNIFAVMGLRTLYFALSELVEVFAYLKFGVAVILFFVGIKMILSDIYHIDTLYSLVFIVACLIVSIGISLSVSSKKISNKIQEDEERK